MPNIAVAIDLDDPGRPRLDDHRRAVGQPLERMHLDRPAGVAIAFRVVIPDRLAVLVELDDPRPAILIEDVAVGQQVQIVDLPARKLPLHSAVGGDGGHRLRR